MQVCWTMCKEGDLGILNPKRDVSIKSLLSGPRKPCRREVRKTARARGDRGHHVDKAFKAQQDPSIYEQIEEIIEAAAKNGSY